MRFNCYKTYSPVEGISLATLPFDISKMKFITCLVLIGVTLFAQADAFRLKRSPGDVCATDADCDADEECVEACHCPTTPFPHTCLGICFSTSDCHCGVPDCHYGVDVLTCDCIGCAITDNGGLLCEGAASSNDDCSIDLATGNWPCDQVSNYCDLKDGVCYCNYMYEDTNTETGNGCENLTTCVTRIAICEDDNGGCYEVADIPGTFECKCNTDFFPSDDESYCVHLTTCVTRIAICEDDNGGCYEVADIPGTFECKCNTDFFPSDDESYCVPDGCSACDEPLEKMENRMICDFPNGECICIDGYHHPSDDPCDPCEDIDECKNETICDANADCINLPGTFRCICHKGFTGSGFLCIDIITCYTADSVCDPIADCTDMGYNLYCSCPDGYRGDGKSCYDIIECGTRKVDCDEHATCKDAFGKYECRCDPGWEGDGKHCEDVKECERHLHHCDPHASCMDDCQGSYTCTCNNGYMGGGYMGDCRRKHGGSSSGGHSHRGRGHRHHGHHGHRGSGSGSGGSGGSGGGTDVSIENNVSVGGSGGSGGSSGSSSSGSH